jgi:hypothetical protein
MKPIHYNHMKIIGSGITCSDSNLTVNYSGIQIRKDTNGGTNRTNRGI